MTSFTSVPDNWYISFFSPPINAFWEALVPDSVTQSEIAFIERHLQVKKGARILDVPCGAGRHSLALAREGFCVTGVDLSPNAIERARAAINELAIEFLHQDMRCLRVDNQFDGAICMGNSFGYLTHEGMQSLLQSLHDCLRPDAKFIIDTGMAAESILATMKQEETYKVNGYVFAIQNEYDIARSRLVTHTVLRKESESWQQSFSHGVYTCGELNRMLNVHNFTVEGWFTDLNDTPYAVGETRLLLVARRR